MTLPRYTTPQPLALHLSLSHLTSRSHTSFLTNIYRLQTFPIHIVMISIGIDMERSAIASDAIVVLHLSSVASLRHGSATYRRVRHICLTTHLAQLSHCLLSLSHSVIQKKFQVENERDRNTCWASPRVRFLGHFIHCKSLKRVVLVKRLFRRVVTASC